MEYTREVPQRRDPAERIKDWFEIYQPFPGRPPAHAGRALHGLRRALLPHRLPADQHHSRLERPGLPRAAGRRRCASCTPPTISRNSPAASVPRRAKPPACWASTSPPVTIKQIEKTIIDRAFRRGLHRARAARRAHRQARRRDRLRARRPGRRAATGARRPRRHGLRKERPHRRPAALRHPEFQDGEAPDRPAPGADARRRA